ncbi:putative Histamine H2 receptor [Hypsibius exemplaris]|uniref:Histamine H2 receptor n=1 Tax=Hypsibius exemplaris TaxID=2072580 RepID=A0A1W0WC25_HYPEX|nr:putative Histamine H2 receptor [Hypsibius exemplaris]
MESLMNLNATDVESFSIDQLERSGNSTPDILVGILLGIPTLTIVVGTIAGNLLVCVAIAHNRQLRKNITNSFCASLAASDLLLGLLVLPVSFGRLVTHSWILGTVLCNLFITLDVFFSTASILNLFIVSIDRYYAITRPLLYRSIITKRTAIAMLTVVWILSALIAFVPIYSGWNTADGRVQNVGNDTCVFAVESVPYSLTIGVGTFYIPLFILYLMYAKILRISYGHVKAIRAQTCRSTKEWMATAGGGQPQRTSSHSHNILRQHRATLTLFIIVGAFTLCWLPYFTCFTVNPLHALQLNPVVEEVFLWMGYSNSFVNPFVYGMTNREYRAAFRRLLCSWKRRSKLSLASYSHSQSHTRSDHEHTVMMPNAHETDLICM